MRKGKAFLTHLNPDKGYMPKFFRYGSRYLLLLYLIVQGLAVSAQVKDTAQQEHPVDTAKVDFVTTVKKLAAAEIDKSISQSRQTKAAIRQDDILENIKKTTQNIRNAFKIGIDTDGINSELDKLQKWNEIAGDGVFTNQGTAQTHRNLTTSAVLFENLLNKALERKTTLDDYYKELINFRNDLDSLLGDSILFAFPEDSIGIIRYLQKLAVVSVETSPADSILKLALPNVQALQNRVNILVHTMETRLEEIEILQKDLFNKTLKPEFSALWGPVGFRRPFHEIINFSKVKGGMALSFYAKNNAGKIFLLLLLIVTSFIFLRSIRRYLEKEDRLVENFSGQLVLRYPLLSAIVIVLNIFQFIFLTPPFIFSMIFWIVSSICLTIIFQGFITKFWMNFWLTIFFLFLLACADNLILQASRIERWGMLALAIGGIVCCSVFLVKGHRKELREKWIIYFMIFVIVLELGSAFTNIYGLFNLSKKLLTSGFFNVIIGILFLWTVRLINEGLSLAFDMYKAPERKLFYINFARVGNKAPVMFYVFLVIGWFILFGRNFYSYRLITGPIQDFLFTERTIGDYSFNIKSLLVFFLILFLTSIISKIVSFFASDKNENQEQKDITVRAGLGSWILLIRIFIISIGLFLAFAAAGIPMDRITIILGALGVGIGLGLQSLVNNLVSGLIISFEKPVNVGDIVEIGGKGGTMKSIGFRSSMITTWEGADVVIPNGDMLNQHLVNWTRGSNFRRGDIVVGVAYGTDLEKTRQILKDILEADKRILSYPAPAVILTEFNNSSIDFKVFFWAGIREWIAVKSDTISAIDIAFKENNIEIPFPQQDLHIRSVINNETEKKDFKNDKDNNNTQ